MAWQEVTYRLTGDAPLICHNGQLADPLYPYTREMKKLTAKRGKTDADLEEIARLEFFGGLYMSEKDGPVVPAAVLDGLLLNAAKKFKEGPKAKAGAFCLRAARLDFDGPRTREELWQIEAFRFMRRVKVQTASVMRMRPIFNEWSLVATFSVEDSVVDPRRLDEWLFTAGRVVGLGDWRPQYGRFSVERLG